MTAGPMGVFRQIVGGIRAKALTLNGGVPARLPGADGERSLLEWACDADDYATGRTRIRVHLLVDRAGQHHLATTVLHELLEKGDGYA